jgi:outer membrane lipoprotein SlyB
MNKRFVAAALLVGAWGWAPALADHRHDSVWLDQGNVAEVGAVREPAPAAVADTNSCIEGSVIGGLLGAGLGAMLSRGNGRWIGVPLGGAAGVLLGCQVDGG